VRNPLGSLDTMLLLVLAILIVFGTVMLYSASSTETNSGPEQGAKMLVNRAVQVLVGLGLLLLLAMMDLRLIARLAPWAWGASMILLVAVLFLPGSRGTRGWLLGQSLQVVEPARVSGLVYMASLLAQREGLRGFRPRFQAPILVLALTVLPVLLQPDYGSALALSLCGGLLLVAAGLPRRVILAGLLLLALTGTAGYFFSGRIQARIDSTYRVDVTQLNDNTYQLGQSLLGIGAGGLGGEGPGKSRQKSFFLPDHHTDFIFAIIAEELGTWGAGGVIILMSLLIGRMLRVARQQREAFGRNLAAAMASMVFVYAGLNLSVALGLFPITGLPLPFLSHGGSALVMNMAGVGLVLSVARQGRVPQAGVRRARREREPLLEDLFREGY